MRASRILRSVSKGKIDGVRPPQHARIFSSQVQFPEVADAKPHEFAREAAYNVVRRISRKSTVTADLRFFAHRSPVLLRDACQCAACVDPSSKQRDFKFTDIPEDIQAVHIEVDQTTDSVRVNWANDIPGYDNHVSQYSKLQIRDLLKGSPIGPSGYRKVSLWDAKTFEEETVDIDYRDVMEDHGTLVAALQLISKHGLVFIVNIPKDENAVMNLVTRLTGLYRNTFYGQTWDVRSVPQAKNVAYTSKVLDFHMDLLYMKEPPALQILHCLENSCTGGESEFVDAFKAVDSMYTDDPELTELLCNPQHSIRYGYDNDSHYYSDDKQVIKRKSAGKRHEPRWSLKYAENEKFVKQIERVYWSPPFIDSIAWTKPFLESSNPSYLNKKWFSATKMFAKKLRTPGFVYETKLPAGTCAVFDNLRVLHARKAFDMNSGKRWLKGVYGDAQDLRSMMRKHVWLRQKTANDIEPLDDA